MPELCHKVGARCHLTKRQRCLPPFRQQAQRLQGAVWVYPRHPRANPIAMEVKFNVSSLVSRQVVHHHQHPLAIGRQLGESPDARRSDSRHRNRSRRKAIEEIAQKLLLAQVVEARGAVSKQRSRKNRHPTADTAPTSANPNDAIALFNSHSFALFTNKVKRRPELTQRGPAPPVYRRRRPPQRTMIAIPPPDDSKHPASGRIPLTRARPRRSVAPVIHSSKRPKSLATDSPLSL